jgi:hypothetical protein
MEQQMAKRASEMSAEELILKQASDRRRKKEQREREKERNEREFYSDGDATQFELWEHNRKVLKEKEPAQFNKLVLIDQRIRDCKAGEQHILDGNEPIDGKPLDVMKEYREICDVVKTFGRCRQLPEWVTIPGARLEEQYARTEAEFPEFVQMGFVTKYPEVFEGRAQNLQDVHNLIHGTASPKVERNYEPPVITAVGVPSEQDILQLEAHVKKLEAKARTEKIILIDRLKNGTWRQ